MRRETSRVSFLMCPFCVRAVLSRSKQTTIALVDAECASSLLRECPHVVFGALDGACHLDA
jgi:hypothetical protein